MNGRFFPLAKLGWAILAPANLLLLLTLATALALVFSRPRLGRWLAIVTAVLFVVFGVLPTGEWLAQRLEDQYPRPPALPAHVDGIVDLGGGLRTDILVQRHAPGAALSESRLVSTFELARRYPDARVVFAGGRGRYPDATAAAYVFGQMGLDAKRLTLESRSRDTLENLLFARAIVRPRAGQTWVLATSAIQMPRAMMVARQLGWKMIPWPTDYLSRARGGAPLLADYSDVVGNLTRADKALHEELGLIAYRLRGFDGAAFEPAGAAQRPAMSNAGKQAAAP